MSAPDLVIGEASARAVTLACRAWHYTHSVPPKPWITYGVWEDRHWIGVVVFGRGTNQNLGRPYGLDHHEVIEGTRLALKQHKVPATRILSQVLKRLHADHPEIKLVITFADPDQGHHGGIYQAGNWIYAGMSSPDRAYQDRRGRIYHRRQVSASGWMRAFGGKRRCPRIDQLTMINIPGKHRYLMPLHPRTRRRLRAMARNGLITLPVDPPKREVPA